MATGTGTRSQTGAITRTDALIRQINLVVQATTGSTTFRHVIEQGVKNGWIQSVTVNGLTKTGKIRQQIEIEINWAEHTAKLTGPDRGEITVNFADDERNWISSVIGQIIDGFNEIKYLLKNPGELFGPYHTLSRTLLIDKPCRV